MVTRRRAFLVLMGFGLLAAGVRADQGLLGFSDERARAQRALEQRFDSLLKADDLREWMRRLSARPHHLGSPYDKENADLLASLFRSWGYDTRIEEFRVLFPTPKMRVLEMLEPTRFTASLVEPVLKEDATSGQTSEQLPVYNAYSIDGDVTAPLVYVNYGVPKDYEELARHGVDVKGKIVIARYGGSWRGIKPKVAAEHGAVGCLIYSDPRDDGYFQGDVYREGAFRNERGAQRGSVADMPLFPGDPLTPGVGATPEAKRLTLSEAPTLTKIPVMPIAYADAQPLLRALRGPVAPEAWAFNWNQVPAYDVIARLRGAERPDEWIVRGNHHDAWVNGANDPISGLVPLLAEAKAIGELHRGGWTPKRTLVFAAWDGEEPGLLGSTEWAEAHADELRQKAAVYINTDSNGRGFLGVGGSHTLERFINEVARDVVDPQTKVSVAERWRARLVMDAKPEDRKEARDRRDLRISALGSGSDFTPFLQHLGIASLNLGYGGEDDGGEYHSIYDSFDLYTRFKDPTFEYGIALAQTVGRAELRLAEADVLPFEFTAFADTLSRYVTEVGKLVDDMREETEETNRRLRDRTYQLAADPKQAGVPPSPRPPVPYLSLAPLQNAKTRVDASAKAFEAAAQARTAAAGPLPVETQKALDAVLMAAEHSLTRAEGLPRRPWFVHQVYAPGFYTGYGVKTLPAVREALEQREWTQAEEQARTVAGVLEGFAAQIDRATAIVSTR